MIIQDVVRTDAEKVFGAISNHDGATLTTHFPVFLITANKNASSVNGNDAASNANACLAGEGSFVGLANSDIGSTAGTVGLYQMYGYRASCLIYRENTSITVIPGHPLGPGAAAASVGLNSTGALSGLMGPVIALNTVTATLNSLATAPAYLDYCFIRNM